MAYGDGKRVRQHRPAQIGDPDWDIMLQAIHGETLSKPLPESLPLMWAMYYTQEGDWVYADQYLSLAVNNQDMYLSPGAALTFQVVVKICRNLLLQAQNEITKAQNRWPDDPLLERSVQLAETLIDLCRGDLSSAALHLTLCRQLIEDGLIGIARMHLGPALVTLALAGNVQQINQMASNMPGFGRRSFTDLEYGIALAIAGDHQKALAIFADQDIDNVHNFTADRARLHRAFIRGDRSAMRAEILKITERGINPLITRELRFLSEQMNAADRVQIFSAALRTHLGTENQQQIYLQLMNDDERLTHAAHTVQLGKHSSACVRLLALFALRAREQEETVLSTETCIAEVLTTSDYIDKSARQQQVMIANLIRSLRNNIAEDLIITMPHNSGYSLNPAYQIRMDVDTVDTLLNRGRLRNASEMLSHGIMQNEQPGETLSKMRRELYKKLFSTMRRHFLAKPELRLELLDSITVYMPWQWPDDEVEHDARSLYQLIMSS